MNHHPLLSVVLFLCCLTAYAQQQSVSVNTNAAVPPLVNFSGVLTDLNGKPMTGTVGVTFLLYKDSEGGAPLWLETQNVQPDKNGHYSVMLGSTSSHGLPSDIFVAAEAHWLGVQVQGQTEQPRVLLVSAPYALKAGDAQTLGGLPASAFVLAAPVNTNASTASSGTAASNSTLPPAPVNVTTSGSGTVNTLPLFSTATDIESSAITQSGSGSSAKIGIGTASPAVTLDVKGSETVRGTLTLPSSGTATASKGFNSQPQIFVSSAFNSTTSTAVTQKFQWQAEPANNDTSTASASLNLLFGQGTTAPGETGLNIASNGQISFAAGQTFPGAGTITSVTAGTDLTGGGSSGGVTLNVDTTKVAQLGSANTFVGNQAITGNLTASGSVSAQTGTISGNSSGVELTVNQAGGGDGINVTALKGFTGVNAVANDTGVSGTANYTGGGAIGVLGSATNGYGIYGEDSAISGTSVGVYGTTTSQSGFGVVGQSMANDGAGASFQGGPTSSFGGPGVQGMGGSDSTGVGNNEAGNGGNFYGGDSSNGIAGNGGSFQGGYGQSSNASAGSGVLGIGGIGVNYSGGFPVAGIEGFSPDSPSILPNGPGVFGSDGAAFSTTGSAYLAKGAAFGVWGDAGASYTGVLATADATWALTARNNSTQPTISASNNSTALNAPVFLGSVGGFSGFATIGGAGCSGGNYWGLQLSQTGMLNCKNYTMLGDGLNTFINAGNGTTAGSIFFRVLNGANAMTVTSSGSVTIPTLDVTKSLTKPAGSFKIDHPLDPANKYLYHSFVESPDMKNIYDGVAELDSHGEAVVTLPDYFEALNRDFRYQLTAIGAPGPGLYIAEKIAANRFKIAGGAAGAEVSWQVTGTRQDAFANTYRIQAEVEKAPEDRGHYLHPELFGAPETARIGYKQPEPPELAKETGLPPGPPPSAGTVAALRRRIARPVLVLPKPAAPKLHSTGQPKPKVGQVAK